MKLSLSSFCDLLSYFNFHSFTPTASSSSCSTVFLIFFATLHALLLDHVCTPFAHCLLLYLFVLLIHSQNTHTHTRTHVHMHTLTIFLYGKHSLICSTTHIPFPVLSLPLPLHSGLMHMHCLLILPYVGSLALLFSSRLIFILPQFFIYPMHTLSKSLCALQGHTRPNCERHRHPLVRHIGIETIRHGILHGPSTAADCLSVCGALWRICVDYHLLGRTTLHRPAPHRPAPYSPASPPCAGNLWQYAVCCLCISPVKSVCVSV